MTKTTIEKMVGTYNERFGELATGKASRPSLKAMRAVLETHVKPMIQAARCERNGEHDIHPDECDCEVYAARIIASLTQEPARDV